MTKKLERACIFSTAKLINILWYIYTQEQHTTVTIKYNWPVNRMNAKKVTYETLQFLQEVLQYDVIYSKVQKNRENIVSF